MGNSSKCYWKFYREEFYREFYREQLTSSIQSLQIIKLKQVLRISCNFEIICGIKIVTCAFQ